MRIYNSIVSKKAVSAINGSLSVLRLLHSLGYDTVNINISPDLKSTGVTSFYKTESDNRFQCIFAEMQDINDQDLYTLFRRATHEKTWNLALATSDYQYLFIAAVRATYIADNTGKGTPFPSVKIRRIDLKHPTDEDCIFLEELTRTSPNDQEMFAKIRYAFSHYKNDQPQMSSCSDFFENDTNESDFAETVHMMRCALQPVRGYALNGSWHDRAEYLIEPILEILGYQFARSKPHCANRVTPDWFLYTEDPELPGTTPVAACLLADPLNNPFYSFDSSDDTKQVICPEMSVRKLLDNPVIHKVFVTDGRIWKIYCTTKEGILQTSVDVYRLLQLDYPKYHRKPDLFRLFWALFSSKNRFVSYVPNPDLQIDNDLLQKTRDSIKPFLPDNNNPEKTARILLFQIFYMLYCEAHNLLPPTDRNRSNVSSLTTLARTVNNENSDQIVDGLLSHLKAFTHFDITRYQSAFVFSSEKSSNKDDLNITSVLTSMNPPDVSCLLDTVFKTWQKMTSRFFLYPVNPADDFCLQLQTILFPDASSSLSSKHMDVLVRRLSMLRKSIEQLIKMTNNTDIPGRNHHLKRVSESVFRFRVIDTKANIGCRLIQVSRLLESFWLDFADHTDRFSFSDVVRTLRNSLIKDSDSQGYILDHACLTHSALVKYLVANHCLYGLTDCAELAGAMLFLHTGLSGIRFPYIGHHFHCSSGSNYLDTQLLKDSLEHSNETLDGINSCTAAMVTASRWFADQEFADIDSGADFAFTRKNYTQIRQTIDEIAKSNNSNRGLPLELVFPWVFYARLSSETPTDRDGHGFDCVID